MAFGFPPYAKTVVSYENLSRGELLDAVGEALEILNWPANHVGPCSRIARVRMDFPILHFIHWGEFLAIEVSDGTVYIRSESSHLGRTFFGFDWGQNQRNIKKLLRCLTAIINQRTRGQRIPRREEKLHEQGIYPAHIRGVYRSVPDRSPAPPAPSSADSQSRPRDDAVG